MKAISLWQPWASLMEVGHKQIETRGRITHIRGDIAICAARTWNKECGEALRREPFQDALRARYSGARLMVNKWNLPFGHVVAVVEIYQCMCTELLNAHPHLADGLLTDKERQFGNYDPGRFGWLTRNRRRLMKPVPVIGRQFIFDLTPEVEAQVRAQIS